ncbi:hypothetical protein [Enterococcus olivae]
MNDHEILERLLVLATKRAEIIDQALSDTSLIGPSATVALQGIRAELDELREIQIANRGLTWEELKERELELRRRVSE